MGLRMDPLEWMDYAMGEIIMMMEAHDMDERKKHETARLAAFWNVIPHLGKDSRVRRPEQLYPLPWDENVLLQVTLTDADVEWFRKQGVVTNGEL